MQLTVEERQKLKEIQMKLFKNFIAVCEKLQLRYFVVGGTALGAVRHGGYIPWDDDIDVGLMREDYDVFLREGQKYLKDGYFLQTFDTDGFPMNFAKIRDENTAFVETTVSNLKGVSHGVYIDVFPLDYFPVEKVSEFKTLKKKYHSCLVAAVGYRGLPFKTRLRWLVGRMLLFFQPSLNSVGTIIRKRDELYRSVPKTDKIVNNCGAWGDREIVSANVYGEGVRMPFEELTVTVPERYDEYLTCLYGDYMTPPPVEKRELHHYCSCFSAEKSYKDCTWK